MTEELNDGVILPGRSCRNCTMCCKLLRIAELNKPINSWCPHCDVGTGCKIYDARPAECADFYCGYLVNSRFGEHWRPSTSKMVVSFKPHTNRVDICVDATRAGSWRREPFYSEIKQLAREAAAERGQVLVWQGGTVTVVFPDSETYLGAVGEDQFILTVERMGKKDAIVVNEDDPRRAEAQRQKLARSAPPR